MRHATRIRAMMVAAAVALSGLAGCGGEAGVAGGEELVGRTFLSESAAEDGAPVHLVAGTRISLEVTGDGRLIARAGCNILSGDLTIEAGTLRTSDFGGTAMGCDPGLHEQDQWLAEFLERDPAWQLAGDRLTLSAGGTELVLLDRRVADPDRPLAGTRWVVDTLLTGEVASSLVAGTEGTAWLLIEGEGFTASSGCRDYQGRAATAGELVTFSETVQTDPVCPPETAQLDELMGTVLTGEVRFEITAGRLRLLHPDGAGLEASADE